MRSYKVFFLEKENTPKNFCQTLTFIDLIDKVHHA